MQSAFQVSTYVTPDDIWLAKVSYMAKPTVKMEGSYQVAWQTVWERDANIVELSSAVCNQCEQN